MKQPNILLITTDQQRGDALGINSNDVLQTPNLDALAARGVNFTRAYTTCPVCIPARRSLLTGLHPASHGLRQYTDGLEFDPPFTLPGLLREAGYQTQLIGKLHQYPQRKRFGFDNIILSETENYRPSSPLQSQNDYVRWLQDRGIQTHPSQHGISGNSRLARPHYLDETLHHNSWLTQTAVRFLTEERDPTCPWFLHLSYYTPHPPLTPPLHYFERYERLQDKMTAPVTGEWVPKWDEVPKGIAPDAAFGPFEPEIIRNAKVGYYGLINHIDDCVAHLLERYQEYGTARAREPIWIVFTSDHGEMMGDHQMFKKALPYEGSARVPFFICGFNVPLQARQLDNLACLEDVAPTVLDLAGVDIPDAMVKGVNGHSLAPLVRGDDYQSREVLFGECGGARDNHFAVARRWKYIWWVKTNEEQLFDLEEDPHELRDVSAQTDELQAMRCLMEAHMETRTHARYDIANLRPLQNEPPSGFWNH